MLEYTDDEIVNFIANFVQKVKEQLVKESSIKFLDAILEKDANGIYSKIGIFRSAEDEGRLSDIAMFQEGKSDINTTLANLKFTASNNEDFGYTMHKGSQYDIVNVVTEIHNIISNTFNKIGKEIVISVGQKLDTTFDIDNDIETLYYILLFTQEWANEELSLKDWCSKYSWLLFGC